MTQAGTVAILALLGVILRLLCCRVAVLPDVTVTVAGLLLGIVAPIVLAVIARLVCRMLTEPRSWRPGREAYRPLGDSAS
jgi:hypothetical protein